MPDKDEGGERAALRAVRRALLMRRAKFREASAEEWTPGHVAWFRWVQRELKRLRLESGKRFQQGLVMRTRDAWRERDFALAHRLIHRLAGTGLGPRKRVYGQLKCCTPCPMQWERFLSPPPAAGGLAAVPIDVEDEKTAARGLAWLVARR